MNSYEYPQIDGAAPMEIQLAQIRSYIFKLTDTLNYNLDNHAAVKLFKEAASALKSSSMQVPEQQHTKDSQALRAAVLELAAGVLTCDGAAYTDKGRGEIEISNIVNIGGSQFTIAGLAFMLVEKVAALEKEIKELKGE